MTRDPVSDDLHTLRAIAERLVRDHRTVTANMAAGLTPQRTGAIPQDADPEGSVAWTQTEAQGNRLIRTQATKYQMLIDMATRALEVADSIRGIHATRETSKLVTEIRCDGYENPMCERNAVTPARWINGAQIVLCDACDRKRRRHAAAEQASA